MCKPIPWSRLPARALVAGGDRSAPTEAAAETGAERCPPGTCAPIGGGETWLPLWGSWHDVIVTERALFKRGCQRGRRKSPPLELNYSTFSPSRTDKLTTIAWLIYGRGQGVGTIILAHAAGETGMRMAKPPQPGQRCCRGTKFSRVVDRPSLFDIIKLIAESFSVLFWQEQ